ncbi:2-oxoacid:acceptor oxidoreductase subunit alpha [Candidatus Gracilibacteria bacterium]|nr:2-oxoacid:acceptor oxidoreductase subunit alpha [Candidatus Gracilibacteria bacterium]
MTSQIRPTTSSPCPLTRTRLRIVGQSGSGLLTVGEIVCKALQNLGFYLCADREYLSLIKGGHSAFTINFGASPVHSLSREADILVAIDKHSLMEYHDSLVPEGIFVHGYERVQGISDILDSMKKKKVNVVSAPARTLATENGGTVQMTNMILLGMTWGVLGFDFSVVGDLVREKFKKKKGILEVAVKCLKAGFESVTDTAPCRLQTPKKKPKTLLLNGNHAIALGAVHAGMRAYIAYPMSPSSTILEYAAHMARDTGIVVKQAEDEITAAQMALGAMFAGTRALVATSGGGYDLMTETVSLAGIIENPLVIVLAQRPGPGTGLPTWTAQGDLNLAIHSSHGEFPRVVIACSDPSDAFTGIQHAFNLAEKYQIPVIFLTEKVIAESNMTVPEFSQKNIPIERGLVEGKKLESLKSSDRYRITKDGVSLRWIPGSSETHYFANGDEHNESGEIDESERTGEMYAKRMRKLETLKKDIPEPEVFSVKENADISFVGWGGSLTVMRDIIEMMKERGVKVNYLHYQYVWPLKTDLLNTFFVHNKNIHLLEGNYEGQLGTKLEGLTGKKFAGKLLKWNGRPFFIEDIQKYIGKALKNF